ncbi:hypothetical protein FHL15_002292 [Xylaria flabelliformis]|uniref:DUF6536 domain-containing protein n=1 Tax=Xylaria flabelliformis TaxID=2512241 RepID=A0A553I9W0_9PEZI|nr:hypothetical protein FHL15_002292 [Xylaria flabelliformis]
MFLYSGDCDEGNVSRLNTGLHFLINVVSSLMVGTLLEYYNLDLRGNLLVEERTLLASSNFFMQILNAPSREEVDTAHAKGSWLLIGVPSVVHLLFNSAVFETDFRESDFHLAVATEEFASGGSYFPPGAGLIFPGIIPIEAVLGFAGTTVTRDRFTMDYDYDIGDETYPMGYGIPVSLSDYFSHERSSALRNISLIAANSSRWKKLDPFDCKEIYLDCGGLKKYRDVVLIINHEGWIRDEMWRIYDDDATFWNQYVPPREQNHLFFDAQCVMFASFNTSGKTTCVNTCSSAMGSHDLVINSTQNAVWYYSFESDPALVAVNSFYGRKHADWHPIDFTNLQIGASILSVEYCLAQPLESTCRVGLSPILLHLVTICVVGKTSAAILVTLLQSRQNQPPLVTLGDAIVSFIETPGVVNKVYCTFGQADIRKAMTTDSAFILSKARKWKAGYVLVFMQAYIKLTDSREWGKYSEGYFSLRVTDPQCHSTLDTIKYHLRLYSHWCNETVFHDPSLPNTSAVYVGYSTKALLALTIISIFLASLPILLSFKRLPRNIVVPGCNSLAISAACHVSRLSNSVKHRSMDDDNTNPSTSTPSSAPTTPNQVSESSYDRLIHNSIETTVEGVGHNKHEPTLFRKLAQSKLRWGVVEMPPEWYTKFGHHSSVVHLSFGVDEDNVSPPVEGKYYA